MIENQDKNARDRVEESSDARWEQKVIKELAFAAITEQRRTRRWNIFFKSLLFGYLFVLAFVAFDPVSDSSLPTDTEHTAVVDVTGVILEGTKANASNVIKGLTDAAGNEKTRGIILNINSPGGSPVQADYIFRAVRQLKKERPELPIHAVVSDMCASGGYYIAAAADNIYVNQSSLIGSIGVIMNGFGFVSAMEKLGVERRLLIAGDHKAILDPFSPVAEMEKAHVQQLLNQVHLQFINAVREGRGKRLKDDPQVFSGLVWTGAEGIELGLADEFGSIRSVAREVIGAEETVNFTPREKFFDRLAQQIGTRLGHVIMDGINPGIRM